MSDCIPIDELSDPAAERELGRAIYLARIQEAWGSHWPMRDKWPVDDAAWRALPHAPSAEIELTLVQARAAIRWMLDQAQ